MQKWIRLVLGVLALTLVSAVAKGDNMTAKIKVTTSEGQPVQLLAEDLTGLGSQPLARVQESLDKKFKKGFFSLYRVQAKAGTELVGEYDVTTVPCRLTVYEESMQVPLVNCELQQQDIMTSPKRQCSRKKSSRWRRMCSS